MSRVAALRSDTSPTSVLRSQATFRAVLDALARPGRIMPLSDLVTPPAPLNPAAAAVLCALADQDTPVYLDRRLAGRDTVKAWIRFHTGAPLSTAPSEAVFALIVDADTMPPLSHFRQGSDAYPDESATVILQVEHFAGLQPLVMQGPGIETTARLFPEPIPRELTTQLAANRARYPCGVDLVFAAPAEVAGLPRTTRVNSRETV